MWAADNQVAATVSRHYGAASPGLLVISVARHPLRRIAVQISSLLMPIG